MKMFLTGEGPTDCGWETYDGSCYVWNDGPVQIYIHKIESNIEIFTIGKKRLNEMSAERQTKRNKRAMQSLDGHGVKAFFVSQIAVEQGYDIVAMYVDADKNSGSAQKDDASCRKRYHFVRDQVVDGLTQGGASRPVAIVPMKMIECWLLGDPDAFERAFGVVPTPALLKKPELIWGDEHNPNSDYPKHRLTKVLAECGEEYDRETFVRIAEESDIKTICKNCPISFADFVDQVKRVCD